MSGDVAAASTHAASQVHRRRNTCRVCGSDRLTVFLSLGPMPLANAFLKSPDEFAGEPRYPLDLAFCSSCSLVQIVDVIDPRTLFSEYLYVTGISETIVASNRDHASALVKELKLGARDLVVDIASNDGSLLRCFQNAGVRTLGIEPAANIAEMARGGGIETMTMFFDGSAAEGVTDKYGRATVVIAKNVLAHVDDPADFLRGCRALAEESGVVSIEVPYLGDLLEKLEYDTVYHEHLSYFSMTSLLQLCERAGLTVERVQRVPVQGGSLRLHLRSSSADGSHSRDASDMAAREEGAGFADLSRYERFANHVLRNREELRGLLQRAKGDGRSIAAYGAPAKGNTLLNFCRIDTSLVEYTVDRNPLKIGLFTPGTHLPVYSVSTLLERQPDLTLLLAWNLADEIRDQQRDYEARGGRFIVPIPAPRFADSS